MLIILTPATMFPHFLPPGYCPKTEGSSSEGCRADKKSSGQDSAARGTGRGQQACQEGGRETIEFVSLFLLWRHWQKGGTSHPKKMEAEPRRHNFRIDLRCQEFRGWNEDNDLPCTSGSQERGNCEDRRRLRIQSDVNTTLCFFAYYTNCLKMICFLKTTCHYS